MKPRFNAPTLWFQSRAGGGVAPGTWEGWALCLLLVPAVIAIVLLTG